MRKYNNNFACRQKTSVKTQLIFRIWDRKFRIRSKKYRFCSKSGQNLGVADSQNGSTVNAGRLEREDTQKAPDS